MDCTREIISSIRKGHRRVDETSFTYNGAVYSNRYGNYKRNHTPISKDEYHMAKNHLLMQQEDPSSLSYSLSLPSKTLALKINSFYRFISELEYDEDYELYKPTSSHLSRIAPEDSDRRVSEIMRVTDFTDEEAWKFNRVIKEYTSTNNYSTFSEEDRELLDRYIDQAPVYMPPPVYRGVGFKEKLGDNSGLDYYASFVNMEIGSILTFRDYASFSSNPDIAVEFAHSNGDHQVYIVNTKNLTGVSIDHLSSIDYHEEELLYKADAKMVVLGKEIKDNTVFLHVEEVSLIEGDYDDNLVVETPICGTMIIED